MPKVCKIVEVPPTGLFMRRKVIAMGKMVADMLVAAEPFLNLRRCIHDTELFMHLGDSILQTVHSQHVMLQHRMHRLMDVDDAIERGLQSAVVVWDRMQKQDLYALVGECLRPVTNSKCVPLKYGPHVSTPDGMCPTPTSSGLESTPLDGWGPV